MYGAPANLNSLFIDKISDLGLRKEAEERMVTYLKKQIYEASFMERILPPKPVSASQCDRTLEQGRLRKIIDKEFTDVSAKSVSFRGDDGYDYIDTDRFAVDFYTIESDEYHIKEQELREKEQPIQALVRHHTAYQIQRVMDQSFLKTVQDVLAANPAQDIQTDDAYILPGNLVDLFNVIDSRTSLPLKTSVLLMTQAQYNSINKWPQSQVDNATKEEFWRDGYRYTTLFGRRVIVTIKADLVHNKTIYAFAAPDYLGRHYSFNDDKFQIKVEWNDIGWKAWRTHGAAIGNTHAVARLRLDDLPVANANDPLL